jgi:mannose-6-phosphate isomerase-like protein (cupin superfamily)
MRLRTRVAFAVIAALGVGFGLPHELALSAQGRGQVRETLAWAPVPVKPSGWVAPNKPHWKLSEILAKHKGQASWRETVVSDNTLQAEYVSMGPGTKTPRMFRPDTRAWWIVQDGQVRFSIEGQEPFVASKGFMVQVPYRNVFSMETVGDTPALFLEVNIAGATTMYPADETPTLLAGHEFVKVRVTGKGAYDGGNKPFVDFSQVVAGTDKTQRFIADVRAVANIIRGRPIPEPPATDKGHFHEESAEFWFIMEGQIRYRIGSLPVFIADQGDVVYVPKQTWHLASFAGPTGTMSTRIAMNGYQDLLHNYQPREETAPR